MGCHRTTFVSFILLAGLMLAGCLGPRRDNYITTMAITVADRSSEADGLWESVQETLRRHRFRLDRVDRRAGVVTTYPVTSQHFLEFWRHDVDTMPDLWEASWNPLRRWVRIELNPANVVAWSELTVFVHKQRLSSPDRQFNSTGAAYQFFGYSLPSTTGAVRVTPEEDRWLDMGRDAAMEDRLLRAIMNRAGLPMSESTSATPLPESS